VEERQQAHRERQCGRGEARREVDSLEHTRGLALGQRLVVLEHERERLLHARAHRREHRCLALHLGSESQGNIGIRKWPMKLHLRTIRLQSRGVKMLY
jgi:hypothetical protein